MSMEEFDFNSGWSKKETDRENEEEPKKVSIKIGETAKEFTMPAIAGAAIGAIEYGGAKIDQFFNPEIIEALRKNWHFWKFFTTEHAMSAFTLDHPLSVSGTLAVIVALVAYSFQEK